MSERKAVRWGPALLIFLVGLAGLSALVLAWQAVTPRPVGAGTVIERLSASPTLLDTGRGL